MLIIVALFKSSKTQNVS